MSFRRMLALSFVLTACRGHEAPPDASPQCLFVLPGATNVSWTRDPDTLRHVRYTLREPFPATHAVEALSARLDQLHWVPRESNSRPQWRENLYGNEPDLVRELSLGWDRPSQAFVIYDLKYSHPSGLLEVHGFCVPAALSKSKGEALKGLSELHFRGPKSGA